MFSNSAVNSIKLAKTILLQNNHGGYTIPSARLYPFQWNWDAGFIALGLTYFDAQNAMDEIRNIFKGQWVNGMLPHIVFHQPNSNYFPGPEEWDTSIITGNTNNVLVSGITQPPVFGCILERMHHLLKESNENWLPFLKEIFPKVLKQHQYLYTHRDPHNEGLVYIQHNWESGTDNSPMWDDIFDKMDISNAREVAHLRKDNRNIDAEERPTDDNYKRYIHIIDILKKCGYNDHKIAEQCPFLVQDVLFNSLLVKSNEGLLYLGNLLGEDMTQLEIQNNATKNAINTKLWNEATGFYYSYDLRNQKPILVKVSSGFTPLYAGIANQSQANALTNHLTNTFVNNSLWKLCPSCAANEAAFNPLKYWRGPAWINVNWMLYQGLQHYKKYAEAKKVYDDTIALVESHGMFEYFDARPDGECIEKRGIGADAFSWTAALYLDMIYNPLIPL
jgi:neutral trehalase